MPAPHRLPVRVRRNPLRIFAVRHRRLAAIGRYPVTMIPPR